VFVYCFLLNLPLGLVGQIRAAYQEGFLQSLFSGAGNVLSLVLVVLAVTQNLGLPALVLAMSAGPMMVASVNLLIFFAVQRPWLTPRLSAISKSSLRAVLSVGLAFLALQIAYVVGFSSDRLVAALVVGPVAAGEYSVVSRLFAIPAGLAVAALTPLWAAYAEAIANRDVHWARATLRRSQLLVLLATMPLAVLLVVAGPTIVAWWTGGRLNPSLALYPSLGAFTIVFAVANAYAMLLNGAQALRFLIWTMTSMAILNILVSIYLASTIGVAGVALGSVITVCGLLILPDAIYTPRLLSKLATLPRERVVDPEGGSALGTLG
jgi:O-antigen/teichoic acid export membrane protein